MEHVYHVKVVDLEGERERERSEFVHAALRFQ